MKSVVLVLAASAALCTSAVAQPFWADGRRYERVDPDYVRDQWEHRAEMRRRALEHRERIEERAIERYEDAIEGDD